MAGDCTGSLRERYEGADTVCVHAHPGGTPTAWQCPRTIVYVTPARIQPPDTGALPLARHGSCGRPPMAARIDRRPGGERRVRAAEGVQRGAVLPGDYPVRRPTRARSC